MTEEEKKSLAEKIKEFFEKLKQKFKNVFNPQFSVFAQEMQESIDNLEFNQEVTMEALEDIVKRLDEADNFIKDATKQEESVMKDLDDFISNKDIDLAMMEINGKKCYVFYDEFLYNQLYDEEGNFDKNADILESAAPTVDSVFRVFTQTDDKFLMSKVNLEEAGLSLESFGFIRKNEPVIDYQGLSSADDKRDYTHSLIYGEFNNIMDMATNIRDSYKEMLSKMVDKTKVKEQPNKDKEQDEPER